MDNNVHERGTRLVYTPDSLMPSRLKRWHTFGHDHFVTFSCFHRLPYLNDDHSRTVFLETLEKLRARHQFEVFGYVLMPEHVHLLLGEPKGTRFDAILRALKTQTSKRLKGDRPRFWQPRYYDFNVFTDPKFVEKLRYIHRNPVTRGLVEKPEEFTWSSYRHWLSGEATPVYLASHWNWQKQEAAGNPTPWVSRS